MVLLRSLLEDTDLMTYFAYYPEEAADCRERLSRVPRLVRRRVQERHSEI